MYVNLTIDTLLIIIKYGYPIRNITKDDKTDDIYSNIISTKI